MQATERLGQIRQNLGVILGENEGDLRSALRELDQAAGQTTGELRHYLSKRSYAKAMDLLQTAGGAEKYLRAPEQG